MISKKDYFHYYGFGIIFLSLFYLFVSIFINNISKKEIKNESYLFFENIDLLCHIEDAKFKCSISNGQDSIKFNTEYSLRELRDISIQYSLNYHTFKVENIRLRLKYTKDEKCLTEWLEKSCLSNNNREKILKWKYEEIDTKVFSQLENL
jgi:hypothetical protein